MAEITDIFATLTPILAGGTLLACTSLRQSDLATRSRNIVDEYLYKPATDGPFGIASRRAGITRQDSVREQRQHAIERGSTLTPFKRSSPQG